MSADRTNPGQPELNYVLPQRRNSNNCYAKAEGRTGGRRSQGMTDARPLCPRPGEAPDKRRMAPVGLPEGFGAGETVRGWWSRAAAKPAS